MYARCPACSRCSSAGRPPAVDDGACAGKAGRGGEGKQILAENQNSGQSEPVAPSRPKCAPPFPLSLPPAERRRVRPDQNSGLRRPSVSPAAAPARESPRKLLKGLETGSTLATRPRRAGVATALAEPSRRLAAGEDGGSNPVIASRRRSNPGPPGCGCGPWIATSPFGRLAMTEQARPSSGVAPRRRARRTGGLNPMISLRRGASCATSGGGGRPLSAQPACAIADG